VFKIFGPGNQYVTVAKQWLQFGVAIDMPAGPSELLIADDNAVPFWHLICCLRLNRNKVK
jgi:histidinol dehydrogenase